MQGLLHFKINKYILFLSIIMIMNTNVFYLVDDTSIPIFDYTIIVEILFAGYVYAKNRKKVKYDYKYFMLFPIVLAIISAFMAKINYHQPLMLGIRPQRAWITAILMYFPIIKLIKCGKLSRSSILSLLDTINLIYGALIVIQYIMGSNVMFMNVGHNERYGSIRLYLSMTFMMISYFTHLEKLLNEKIIRVKDVFLVILPLFLYCFVTKSRMGIVVMLGTSILAILSQKLTTKKLCIIGACVVVGCMFLESNMGRDIMAMAFDTGVSDQDSSKIRDLGRTFFVQQNMKSIFSMILGSGFANITWPETISKIGYDLGYYYNDNGLFGLFFYYGFLFIGWTVLQHIKLISCAWKNNSKNLVFYLLFGLLGSYTLFPSNYVNDISFAIVCVLIEASSETSSGKLSLGSNKLRQAPRKDPRGS